MSWPKPRPAAKAGLGMRRRVVTMQDGVMGVARTSVPPPRVLLCVARRGAVCGRLFILCSPGGGGGEGVFADASAESSIKRRGCD